jgi:DNA-binding PadR family transcriptional regulator
VSPVFRHGRLRLYLLKLLDEAPRHGYEVIRLLQDRFLGVYSPSPGTIYPRLTRLEEEGLVTRDEVDGKKVYRITDKGRQELRSRIDELSELEDELTASARGIALEIGRDVRDTVRSLREELGRASTKGGHHDYPWQRPGEAGLTQPGSTAAGSSRPGSASAGPGSPGSGSTGSAWTGSGRPGTGRSGSALPGMNRFTERGQGSRSSGGHSPWAGSASWPDLERLAADFAKEILAAAVRARSGLDEAGLRDVRGILADALTRIKTEVFGPHDQGGAEEPAPEDAPPTA